jgi:hypothetical protein
MARLEDLLTPDNRRKLNKMRKDTWSKSEEKERRPLPVVLDTDEEDYREIERLMRRDAYTRRRGAIRQTRHSE